MLKKDIFITVLVGVLTGFIWRWVFVRLGTLDRFGLGWVTWGLVVLVPLAYLFGLYLGEWLSKKIAFFKSFVRYVMVGFLNTGVDFAVFNLLMLLTHIEKGLFVSSFKTVSFIAAVTNSYFWNKYWAFEAASSTTDKSKEFAKFIIVNVVGALLNVGITSAIIFTIPPQLGLSQLAWNNVAAVISTSVALIWNFIGLRLIVFKKKNDSGSVSQISA